jgi:co-chaperonin GroES (HSP10)
MALSIQPIGDRVVVEAAPAEEKNSFRVIYSRYSERKTISRYSSCCRYR